MAKRRARRRLRNDNSNSNNAKGRITIIAFRSPFEDKSSPQPSYHEITFTMATDVVASSVNDQGTGYRIKISRIPNNMWTGSWTKQILEVSAHDKTRVLEEDYNYTRFYDNKNGQQNLTFCFILI